MTAMTPSYWSARLSIDEGVQRGRGQGIAHYRLESTHAHAHTRTRTRTHPRGATHLLLSWLTVCDMLTSQSSWRSSFTTTGLSSKIPAPSPVLLSLIGLMPGTLPYIGIAHVSCQHKKGSLLPIREAVLVWCCGPSRNRLRSTLSGSSSLQSAGGGILS